MYKRYYFILARVLSFLISAALAYGLWTFLRHKIFPQHYGPQSSIERRLFPKKSEENQEKHESPMTKVQEKVEQARGKVVEGYKKVTQPKEESDQANNEQQKHRCPMTKVQEKTEHARSKIAEGLKSKKHEDKDSNNPAREGKALAGQPIKALAANRMITLHNGIERTMLGYKRFGTHYPTSFKVTIQNKTVDEGATLTIPIQNNTLMVRYDFEFMNGYRNGAKEVTFTLKPNVNTVKLTFNWKKDPHIFIEEDTLVSYTEKDVPYNA